MTKAEIEAEIKKHGGNKTAAGKALGLTRSQVNRALKGAKVKTQNGNSSPQIGKVGRSLQEFRAAHDKNFIVPGKIREALKSLGDGWEYEAQFIRLAGISAVDMGNFREQFAEHIVVVDRTKRVWAGTKATASKLREMV